MHASISKCVCADTEKERDVGHCHQGPRGPPMDDTWADTLSVTIKKMRSCMAGAFADLQPIGNSQQLCN